MEVLDRKQAAKLLNLSIRTVDRYIKSSKFPIKNIGGRVFIHLKDLQPILKQKGITPRTGDFKQPVKSNLITTDIPINDENVPDPKSKPESKAVYRKLFEELQEELKSKQKQLEGANYRVGQLEGMLKESVPLLDYKKAMLKEQEKRESLETVIKDFEDETEKLLIDFSNKQNELKQVDYKLSQERLNKRVFLIILIILFLLQPLWLIFPLT